MTGLETATAAYLARELRAGRLGAEELARAYMARIEKYDGADGLNAVAELDEDVLKTARSLDCRKAARELPLFGLPILVKDNIDVAGLHTTAGSLALGDNLASRDAPVIANLRRNGALIMGKTNMTEFANYTTFGMPGGYSSRGGQVKNAYDPQKSPSGSSSGSAVAVSAGLCAAAIGTDTSFSIVGCATENGVVGLKPARGALSGEGIVPIARTLDSAGPLSRDVSDALLVYSGMRETPLAPVAPTKTIKLRIAVNAHNRDKVSEAQLSRYEALFARLRAAGARFQEVAQPHTERMRDIMRCEFRRDLEAYLASSNASLKTLPDIVAFYEADPERMLKYGDSLLRAALDEASGNLDDAPYIEALAERERLRGELAEGLRGFDACVMTGPTNVMHMVGLPSIALKMCMADDGCPRGIILYGADEARLASAALAIEKYCEDVTPPRL